MPRGSASHTTIKDIARQLGVAPSTVTKALNDYPDVGAATKEKARSLARKLGYLPNSVAQSLQSGATTTIGLIVPEIKHHFFSAALDGIEDVAYGEGYSVFVCKSNEDCGREVINTRNLLSHSVAGIIVSMSQTTRDVSHFGDILARNIPLVFFDRVSDAIAANRVIVDDRAGATSAVKHLIGSGYRRIAHLAGPAHLTISSERVKGYAKALERAGIPFNAEYLIHGGFDEADGAKGFEQLMRLHQRPDAVFCVNDPVALGVLFACKKRGMRIPGDLAIVGFSDNPVVSQIDPPLTTVAQPAYEMGAAAAKMLMRQIKNGRVDSPPEVIKLRTKLIVRKTT